ncbi:MAG TPA: orotidine-5'-phosphate decarboxylase [Solirubrobacteraceae bacterium]
MSGGFAQRLGEAVERRQSQIVLGLDPNPASLWPAAAAAAQGAGSAAERAARAVFEHCRLVIGAAAGSCVGLKPQLACFERLGAPGWWALAEVVALAHEADLLVIADGKRGDFPLTASAYAQALAGSTQTLAGEVTGLGADAFTANPLLGRDALEPMVASGAGVFVLVRTSNPGAADLQDLPLADGTALWERIALLVDELGTSAGALSDVGAVVGATHPEYLERARALMPRAIFLLPGVGAQGGRAEDLGAAFAPGRAGGLLTASRSIVNAHEQAGGDPAAAAAAEAERLRAVAWSLAP